MGIFFCIDDKLINFDDPSAMVKDQYRDYFARKELAPFILSEICVLDMIYSVAQMNDGYYRERLVLKGGLSVRNHVPLIDHRFSFDADYNPNTLKGFTYGDVSNIRNHIMRYGSMRRCGTKTEVTKDNGGLYFIEIGYWDVLKDIGYRIIERPKIEISKTFRVFTEPVKNQMNTIIDLDILGLKPPAIYHVALEEQFATKLFIIGSSGRQRNHFDAYDAQRIVKNNKMDWKLTRKLFDTLVERHKSKPSVYIEECRHQLDAMTKNSGKRTDLENTVFRRSSFDFDAMVHEVKSFYNFRPP